MPRGNQWIFIKPCDCPVGVMEGYLAKDPAAAMDEMYEGLPDERERAERAGITAHSISFERYTERYYNRMTVSCPHGGERVSFIPKAKLWLPIRRNADVIDLTSSNGNELWSTRRLIAQRLEPGDSLILWPDVSAQDYDPAGGPKWPVKEVFWDADGIMQVELALMIYDPAEDVRKAFHDRVRRGWNADLFNSKRLWTPDEGVDFDYQMESGGWRK